MASRWEEYLSWYPEDQQQFNRIADLITSREVSLPGGEILSVPRLQQLGMFLGGNSRVDQLHYLLEDAILPGGNLHPGFLEQTHQTLSYAAAPLYAVLHESIYAQNSATRWAAERVRDEFDEFSSSATNIFPTGEHIQQEFFTVDPGLRPFRATAEVLAAKDDWPDLYDVRQLASNQVPVAAAIYQDDVYVPVELSRETANRVRNMHVWHSDEHHHDGLRADGQNIFSALATSIGLPGYH